MEGEEGIHFVHPSSPFLSSSKMYRLVSHLWVTNVEGGNTHE